MRLAWLLGAGLHAAAALGCAPIALHHDGFEGSGSKATGDGTACVIDSGAPAAGIRQLLPADLDQDGQLDLTVAQAFNVDRINHHRGLGAGQFAPPTSLDAALDDPVALAVGDFDADGRVDLASLTATKGTLRVYAGQATGLGTAQLVDSGRLLGNALVAGQFDAQGGDDLVVIGQHSIDFFRSQTGGPLGKEPILTPETAPDVLECLALSAADLDADGDLDLAVAETRGGVLYRNNGLGQFTPQVFTTQRRILTAIHLLDADGNTWPDAVVQVSTGDLLLYHDIGVSGPGAGTLLMNVGPAALGALADADLEGDGWSDLHLAFAQQVWTLPNLAGQGFGPAQVQVADPAWFYTEVAAADVDGDGRRDLLWSAVNGQIGWTPAAAR